MYSQCAVNLIKNVYVINVLGHYLPCIRPLCVIYLFTYSNHKC